MRGRIRDIVPLVRKTLVSLELDVLAAEVEKLSGKELNVSLSRYTERRSISQNAYYWVLLSKTAAKVGVSTAYMHNDILQRHPRPLIIGGKVAHIPVPDTEEAMQEAMESVTYHIKAGSQVMEGADGIMYRTYTLLRGSSDYDTEEMTVLLNDLIEEAKAQGIETATPAELARMRAYDEERRSA